MSWNIRRKKPHLKNRSNDVFREMSKIYVKVGMTYDIKPAANKLRLGEAQPWICAYANHFDEKKVVLLCTLTMILGRVRYFMLNIAIYFQNETITGLWNMSMLKRGTFCHAFIVEWILIMADVTYIFIGPHMKQELRPKKKCLSGKSAGVHISKLTMRVHMVYKPP